MKISWVGTAGIGLGLISTVGAIATGCGSTSTAAPSGGGASGAGGQAGGVNMPPPINVGTGGSAVNVGNAGGGPQTSGLLLITPATMPPPIVQTGPGKTPSPVTYKVTYAATGAPATGVTWSIDRPELGTIDRTTGVFTPKGIGGTATITAVSGASQGSTTITVIVKATQEGDTSNAGKPVGPGGVGGVGGEGGGSKITDPALRAALDKPAMMDTGMSWLYPYDGTVWPRGLLAPLLQWKQGAHAAHAVKIHIEVDTVYTYDGYFGPPPALPMGQPIMHVPIPQEAWQNALSSGSTMKISLTVAASDSAGGYVAYAPPAGQTWTIAPGALKGTVYYNSYGTKLAQNYGGAKGGDGRFGGATLAIRGNSVDPAPIAGTTTSDHSGCRVCHTVSANGSLLISQHEPNTKSSAYALQNKNAETVFPDTDNGKFGWAALSPDGSLALGNAGPPGNDKFNTASLDTTALYSLPSGATLTAQGLSSFVTQASTPSFSADGKHVAFNLNAGRGTAGIPADGRSLVQMDFSKVNDTTYAFTNPKALYMATAPAQRPGWPSFLPDSGGAVFELELQHSTYNGSDEVFVTRAGAQGELWWADLSGNAHPLDRANGKGYLPQGPNGHDNDTALQYEPTVAPLVAGGYAWVIFTSRRLYGNIATRDPYQSDPRDYDLTQGNPNGPTTKKLWVAAIDVPPKPGADPSHPAFYLPAQELFAGNSRGFWVLDPCKQDSSACGTGDECCGGYCRTKPDGSGPVCGGALPLHSCAQEYEKCMSSSDCCSSTTSAALSCINDHCAMRTKTLRLANLLLHGQVGCNRFIAPIPSDQDFFEIALSKAHS